MSNSDNLIDKTCVMLTLQDQMNSQVDRDWRQREREWYRAIWIECAELMDHYGGWKWWKHSTPDMPQVILEIVDIWHFGLSMRLEQGRDNKALAQTIVQEWQTPPTALTFLAEVERLASHALTEQVFSVGSVANLLHACDAEFDDLYRNYVAKNVLNLFRQKHGYKTGSYQKIWHGREDNEVLAELLHSLDADQADFPQAIDAALESHYAGVTGA